MSTVLDVLLLALGVVNALLMACLRICWEVTDAAVELIALAEETGLSGTEKMELVVSKLQTLIPAPFARILTANRLEDIAQRVFDWMRKYADTRSRKEKS